MGEVPVAVIDPAVSKPLTSMEIQTFVAKNLGTNHIFAHILTLETLGEKVFPVGPGGKIRKGEVRKLIENHLESRKSQKQRPHAPDGSPDSKELETTLQNLLSVVLNIATAELSTNLSFKILMDSLTALRFCFDVNQATDKALAISDLIENDTIEKLAGFLNSQTSHSFKKLTVPSRDGPPTVNDMAHTDGSRSIASATQHVAEAILRPLGLSWDADVEEVFPVIGYSVEALSFKDLRTAAYNTRWDFVLKNIDGPRLKTALKAAVANLARYRLLTLKQDKIPLFIQIRPSERWYRNIICDGHVITNAAEICYPTYAETRCCFPEPLCRMIVSASKDGTFTGLSVFANYATFDGVIVPRFFDTLERMLRHDHTPLPSWVGWKLWADMYYKQNGSIVERRSTNFLADRIRGFRKHASEGWPPLRRLPRSALQDTVPPISRLSRGSVHLKSLSLLKEKHNVSNGVVIKAAVAIAMYAKTGNPQSCYSSVQSGRAWPGQDSGVQEVLPNPLSIDGCVCNNVPEYTVFDDNESLLSLLLRIENDQIELLTYPHINLDHLLQTLPPDESKAVPTVFMQRAINLVPDILRFNQHADDGSLLQPLSTGAMLAKCLFWQCGFIRDTFHVAAMHLEEQISSDEMSDAVEFLLKVLASVCHEVDWDVSIGEFVKGVVLGSGICDMRLQRARL